MSGASAVVEWRTMILASNLSSSARLVALVLSTHMNRAGGSCFPSVETVAAESALSRRTVQRAVRELEAAELLTTTVGGGRRRATRYLIKGVTVAPFVEKRASQTTGKGVTVAQEDVQEDVHNFSLRASARGKRKGRRAKGTRPDLSYYDEAGKQ